MGHLLTLVILQLTDCMLLRIVTIDGIHSAIIPCCIHPGADPPAGKGRLFGLAPNSFPWLIVPPMSFHFSRQI